ncbi:MAG TPA: hypothetical protein VEK08_11215 [Planctomycetota bacterium]|nr:hypothetical protein [Planctomycetota bacterium]
MTTVAIQLPDDLAQRAEAAGLLDPKTLEGIVREEIRRRLGAQLLETQTRVNAKGIATMSLPDIQAEVNAVRTERQGRHARSL